MPQTELKMSFSLSPLSPKYYRDDKLEIIFSSDVFVINNEKKSEMICTTKHQQKAK